MHKGIAREPGHSILGFTQAGWPGMFLDWMAVPPVAGKNYIPVAPLKGPSGLQESPMTPYGFGSTGKALITKDQ